LSRLSAGLEKKLPWFAFLRGYLQGLLNLSFWLGQTHLSLWFLTDGLPSVGRPGSNAGRAAWPRVGDCGASPGVARGSRRADGEQRCVTGLGIDVVSSCGLASRMEREKGG